MAKLIRAITSDGAVSCVAIDSTDMVAEIEKIHKPSATVTAALGRLLTASSMIGCSIKSPSGSVTLRLAGGGPAGVLIAVADSNGNARGYVTNPIVEIPLNQYGKLDVAGAVGSQGSLSVIKDLGYGEPYIGNIEIVSGEIAEDITHYFAVSEQIPTVCALGVLVNPDLSVKAAGGFLIQLLPGADDETISRLEAAVNSLKPITTMLSDGMSIEEIVNAALDGFEVEVLEKSDVFYRCDCSEERVVRALVSIGEAELKEIYEGGENTEVLCHFCSKAYSFTPAQIMEFALAAKKTVHLD